MANNEPEASITLLNELNVVSLRPIERRNRFTIEHLLFAPKTIHSRHNLILFIHKSSMFCFLPIAVVMAKMEMYIYVASDCVLFE